MRSIFKKLLALSALPLITLAQRPLILTESATTSGKYHLEAGLGAEYYHKHEAPAPDLPISEWRVSVLSARFGVAENVDFDLDWRGRLLAKFESGLSESDWGDLTVATKINLLDSNASLPSIGIRTAVKLPNTAYLPYKLGNDNTDFYFHLLFSKHVQNVETQLNIGFGILGDPEARGGQDDIYLASVAGVVPLSDAARFFVEVYGFTGPRDDDDKLLARSGILIDLSAIELNIYGSIRMAGSNRDFGGAFEATENWSVGVFLQKNFQF